jgi:hypothetical protein
MITIDPNLMAEVARSMRTPSAASFSNNNVEGVNVASGIVGIGGSALSSAPAPLAWLELDGYVNMCSEGHAVVGGRRYIYDWQELVKAVDAMNATKPIIVASGSQMDAAVATGLIPASARPAKPSTDMAEFRAAFGVA